MRQRSIRRYRSWAAPLGFALILTGYLAVWLRHPTAAGSLIGLEVGEWVKFLPAFRGGAAPLSRNWFYLPPLTLGLFMALHTAGRPGHRWQTWVMRSAAVAVSLLSLPQLEVIRDEPSTEWRLRVLAIGGVAVVALASAWLRPSRALGWFTLAVALLGAIMPTVAYLATRPLVAAAYNAPVATIGIGAGVWLNVAGHVVAGWAMLRGKGPDRRRDPAPIAGSR